MVFWNIVIAAAAFFLNLILMPKPQNAKPASLEDFDVPVAEEGIEIPVAFGTVYIKAPNVMWYGDLRTMPVKGERRYGFFGPRQVIGHQYLLGMHMVLCNGVHDEIRRIWAGDKLIYPATEESTEVAEGNTVILIDKLDVFGGDDREGGIYGFITLMGGAPDQTQDAYLAAHLAGDDTPAFRGVVTIIWNQLYIGNNAYIKPWKFLLKRIHKTSRGQEQWYDEKAAVPDSVSATDALDMNPAHIIRECLTDHYWGMGYAAADIDDDSFTTAADQLHSEYFGMSLLWTREEKLEEFMTVVLSHIDAYLYLKRTTGKFYLKLIRKDYSIEALPVFTEDDVVTWDEVVRRAPAEAINSVIVKYTDRRTTIGDDASLQVDNLAQIQALGERIGTTRVYPGVSRAALASRLASRDQLSLGIGMISGRVTGKRTWDSLYPGDPFRLVSDRHRLEGEIMRVASMKFGDGRDNRITVEFVQDVFNFGVDELVDSSAGDWESPLNQPAVVVPRLVWEAPYRDFVGFLGPANATTLLAADADAGVIEVAGVRPTSDSTDALLYVDSVQEDIMSFSPGGLLDLDAGALDTEVTLTDDFNLNLIDAGTLAVIIASDMDIATAEIVRVDAVVDNVLTISRGFVDTVPQAHAAGDWVIVYGEGQMSDFEPRTAAEAPVIELLTRTGLGTLTQALAPDDAVDMDSRAARPLRPANVQVEGEAEGPVNATGQATIEVTLAERNRLTEIGLTLLAWDGVTVVPEAGQTIVLEVLDPTNTTVLATHAGLVIGDFPYAVPLASFGANTSGWIRAGAARDGYREWQAYAIETLVGGPGSAVGAAATGTGAVTGISSNLGSGVGSVAGTSTATAS